MLDNFKELTKWKFILPAATIVIGGAMVWTGKMQGSEWAMMSTTLVTGFYAITGWGERQEVNKIMAGKNERTREQ